MADLKEQRRRDRAARDRLKMVHLVVAVLSMVLVAVAVVGVKVS